MVKNTRKGISRFTDGTYYSHLNCTRGSNFIWRVDWRDVCDGQVDCSDGADEAECWQLEQNVCKSGEYRCLNGQCIPGVFFDDDVWDPDCMDGTDEHAPLLEMYPRNCNHGDPSIRCEDTTCRHWAEKPCSVDSDCAHSGSCHFQKLNAFTSYLITREANSHLSDECWTTMYCAVRPSDLVVSSFYFFVHDKIKSNIKCYFHRYQKKFLSHELKNVVFCQSFSSFFMSDISV
jgi:hypothetical protein